MRDTTQEILNMISGFEELLGDNYLTDEFDESEIIEALLFLAREHIKGNPTI